MEVMMERLQLIGNGMGWRGQRDAKASTPDAWKLSSIVWWPRTLDGLLTFGVEFCVALRHMLVSATMRSRPRSCLTSVVGS